MSLPFQKRMTNLAGEGGAHELQGKGAIPQPAWWKRFAGAFENDPLFEETVRQNRAYREAQRPAADSTGEDGV